MFCTVLDRDLFYQDPVLFGSQDSLDSLIDDAALVIQVPRSQLHVVSAIYLHVHHHHRHFFKKWPKQLKLLIARTTVPRTGT